MKKRLLTIIIILVLLSIACKSSGDKKKAPEVGEVTEVTEVLVETEKDETKGEKEIVSPTEPIEPIQSPTEVSASVSEVLPFEEIVVVDNTEVVIKLTGIDPDDSWGYGVKTYLENKSDSKTYRFSVVDAYINGVQCDRLFSSEIGPGKKEFVSISFNTEELSENKVTEFTDIEIVFSARDADDWLAEDVAYETINIYPYGEDKAIQFVRESMPNDNVVIDNEYVTMIVTGYEHDDIWGFTANLYLVNKTDKEVLFSVSNGSVNGFMVNPFFYHSLLPSKVSFSTMSWSDSSLEEQGITDIEEIEFTLRVYEFKNYDNDLVNEVIRLIPN